jgi:site-specific recombinase XerD
VVTPQTALNNFLRDIKNANKSPQTIRAYRSDLIAFLVHCPGNFSEIETSHLRAFFDEHESLKPATRARKQTAVASFLKWGYQHDLIDANPMLKIDRAQVEYQLQPPPCRDDIERIFQQIPDDHLRDRLLFKLIFETGMRINEALSLHIEDFDLSFDDEHVTVLGKGQRQRTILLDDFHLVVLLKRYLKKHSYQHGPLFRAHKNYQGGALRYQSAQEKWNKYCQQAGIECTLHQLRHAHATELINDGVSLATIRKRLGHKHIQTTLHYAQLTDETADAEIRTWRRGKQ